MRRDALLLRMTAGSEPAIATTVPRVQRNCCGEARRAVTPRSRFARPGG